ncbi:MAG: hypothetical protein IPG66_16390 [Hydrogenophilales bacterium]|nr:hypothetical protein [Hydrogenophilales bacterium]
MRYLILAQSKPTAHALGAWLDLLGERPIEKLDDDQRVIVWEGREGLPVAQAFERLSRALEAAAYGDGEMPSHHRVVVLVDGVARPGDLNIVAQGGGWESLLAMLILAFPEFRWVFGMWGVSADESTEVQERSSTLGTRHSLVSLLVTDESDPLFDATGLRVWIRERTNHCLAELNDDLRLPLRGEMAAIIEEEQAYLYFNGYCAYRFGFRADLIASWQRMKNNFGRKGERHPYWLLLEDMSLNFPDREKGIKLHCLQDERAQNCPQLDSRDSEVEQSRYRVLITTGQTRPGDDTLSRNRANLREKAPPGRGALVLKPACGQFDLWERAGLMRRHEGNPQPGLAPSYHWPPRRPEMYGESDGHGAPGKLLLVAEKLIERAEALKSQVKSVAGAVLGATLANDALELTGARTPTTAIEALGLKHQFEVMAECQFSGVEYHIRIEPRIAEITRDLDAICEWFGKSKRESARLNARMHILNQLVRILRDHNQFDEEQLCMNRVRHIHNTLWVRQRSVRVLLLPLLRYLELLLSSFATFSTVLLGWLVIFALLFWWIGSTPGSGDNWSFWCGLQGSVSTFFSVGPPTHPEGCKVTSTWGYVIATTATIFSGFFHLGVFVSHLYSIVARR